MRAALAARTLAPVLAGALLVTVACAAPAPSSVATAPQPDLAAQLVAEVTGAGALAHLEHLQRIADSNGGNRALGTPGYDASVDYVADTLREAGYDVQTPTVIARQFAVTDQRLTVGGTPLPVTALQYSPSTPAGGLSAPLAVVAQDATSGCEPSDFSEVVAGSVVLVRRGTCPFSQKTATAAAAGAVAVLVVNTEDRPLTGASLGTGPTGELVPTGGLSRADGAALAERAGDLVTLVLDTELTETPTRNVLAQTRTGDPARVVMAGAHLDSVPTGPGINDNGSGVAALLETAVRLGGSPPVTHAVRFGFWGAEETGLTGSTEYVMGLDPATRAGIALYLNVDMVASPNAAYFVYDGDDSDRQGAGPGPPGSTGIERVLVEALAAAGVSAEDTDLDARSDYAPFAAVGIPVGGLFTGAEQRKDAEQARLWGGHPGAPFDPCYHQPCDRLDGLDLVALDRNTDAIATAVGRFAQSLDALRN